MVAFQKHRKQGLFIIHFNNGCFWPITYETKLRLLNLGSNIRDRLCVLFFSYFFKNERKPSKTPHTFLLVLEVSNDNSKVPIESSSIKSSKLDEIPSFKLIVIVTFKASKNNQCPHIGSTHRHLQLETKHQQWFEICVKLRWKDTTNNPHYNLLTITKNNCCLELQCLLK